jgi:hypothetical protein
MPKIRRAVMTQKNKAQFVKLGSFNEKRDGEGYYIKLNDNVQLTINGQTFDGKYFNVEKPDKKYAVMLDRGIISEEEAEKKIESIPSFVRFELTAVLNNG